MIEDCQKLLEDNLLLDEPMTFLVESPVVTEASDAIHSIASDTTISAEQMGNELSKIRAKCRRAIKDTFDQALSVVSMLDGCNIDKVSIETELELSPNKKSIVLVKARLVPKSIGTTFTLLKE